MSPDLPADWLQPQWPAPAGVRACMSTVSGGVSQGLFASMNLGDHVGDDPAAVAANRALLAARLAARPVFMRQVHGLQVVELATDSPDGLQADGAVSVQPGLACVVMVADCLPILLAHERVPGVAALHAGWRGLAGQGGHGIVEAGWAQLQRSTGLPASELAAGTMAWLGPCIGPRAFEVGAEVREAFVQAQPESAACFKPRGPGKFLADLPALARLSLQRQGITRIHGNDGSDAWCTVTSESRFFSHRRDRVSGRLAASVWLA